jgi:hypothetical protein
MEASMNYIRNRLTERSTWIDFGVAVSAAAFLPAPYSYLFIAIGVIGALVPDGRIEG